MYLFFIRRKKVAENIKNIVEEDSCQDFFSIIQPMNNLEETEIEENEEMEEEMQASETEKEEIQEREEIEEEIEEIRAEREGIHEREEMEGEIEKIGAEREGIHEREEMEEEIEEIGAEREGIHENHENLGSGTASEPYWVVERAQTPMLEPPIVQGIDFVDFGYVFEQIINLQNHSTIGCGIEHLKIVGCQQKGLEKSYNVQCKMCNHIECIRCLPQNDNVMDINHNAVSATMLTGGGYTQLEEIMCGMNVQCMSRKIYEKCQENIIEAFEVAALQEMAEAGREEKDK